ncbi:HamA C-terminal domain-containing protein [Corynebacterium segmentosum]
MSKVLDTETELACTLYDREAFLRLFYDPIEINVNQRSNIKLSILQIQDGEFVLDQFYDLLVNSSLAYVLSRVDLEKTKNLPVQQLGSVFEDIKSRFQKVNDTNAEGGEILLYALLEAVLRAPKLLSKMELKTSNQMPIYGADGVHLLKVEEDQYQLIFGESKLYGSLRRGLDSAFTSMDAISNRAFREDLSLVSTQMMKEAVTETQLDLLESILLPHQNCNNPIKLTKTFGVLVGFDLDVSDVDISSLEDDEIEIEYKRLATNAVEAQIDFINKKIDYYRFGAKPIHLFAVPFLKYKKAGKQRSIKDVRKEMQFRLAVGKRESDAGAA